MSEKIAALIEEVKGLSVLEHYVLQVEVTVDHMVVLGNVGHQLEELLINILVQVVL